MISITQPVKYNLMLYPKISATQEFPLPGVSSFFWASHEPYGVTGFCPSSGQPQQTTASMLVNAMRAAPTLLL